MMRWPAYSSSASALPGKLRAAVLLMMVLPLGLVWPAQAQPVPVQEAPAQQAGRLRLGVHLGAAALTAASREPREGTLGPAAGVDLFYHLSPALALGASHHAGAVSESGRLHLSRLLFRIAFGVSRDASSRRPHLYLQAGAHRKAYDASEEAGAGYETGYGASGALGLSWPLSGRLALFQEVGADLSDDVPITLSAGLRLSPFRRRARPGLLGIEGPERLLAGEEARFTVTGRGHRVGEEAGGAYFWDFGDGPAPVAGADTSVHRYDQPGTYTVAVTRRDRSGRAEKQVLVVPGVAAPDGAAPRAAPGRRHERVRVAEIFGRRRLQVGQTENYRVRVEPGAAWPIEYAWDLGDGTRAVGNNVAHRYMQEGRYRVAIRVRNRGGADSLSFTVVVEPPPVAVAEPAVAGEAATKTKQGPSARPAFRPTSLHAFGGIDPSQGGYTWIVQTFLDREQAAAQVRHYRAAGYRADVLIDESGEGSPAYRVALGQFATEQEARAARRALPTDVLSSILTLVY